MTAVDKSAFVAAKRAEVDRLEALARELLDAHPEPESLDEKEEADWRELAYASRQMRPLLEALERANAGESGFEVYKEGFDFRLIEAITTVATLCAHGRLNVIRQGKRASKDRPRAESPFRPFIKAQLKRNPQATAKEIETALVNSEDFELSSDGLTFLTVNESQRRPNSRRRRKLKISGIPAAVSKARKKVISYR
jgi:hypothetical protein